MVGARRAQDIPDGDAIKGGLLAVLSLAALAVAAHAVVGVRVGEGEAVGRDAHHVAVLLVQLVDGEGEAPREPAERVGDLRGRPELGAWHGAERVEEEVVDDVGGGEEDAL